MIKECAKTFKSTIEDNDLPGEYQASLNIHAGYARAECGEANTNDCSMISR